MRKCLLISLMLFASAACQNGPGKDMVPPDTLVPMLVDFHMVYSIQSSQVFRTLSREVDSIDTYSYIFDKHGVTKAMFDSTISWYSQHPKYFTEIYDRVIMHLSQISDSLGIEEEVPIVPK